MIARADRHSVAQRRALLQKVRSTCENLPGTYRMLGADGRILYVGKSRRLRARLLSYFRAKGRRNKSVKILRHAFAIDWQYSPDEFAALLDELRLIKLHRPHFNQDMMNDEWPRAYVALTSGKVPGLRVVRRTDDARAASLWGPFRRVSLLADAVHALAELTGVRDCTLEDAGGSGTRRQMWFANDDAPRGARKQRTPGCLRAELGSCPGPCIGSGDSDVYDRGVREALAFLSATDDAPLRAARARMQSASDALEFERAAVWRDKVERLSWLFERLSGFHASMDRLTFVYTVSGHSGESRVYLVRRGTVRAQMPVPRSMDEERALETLCERIFGAPDVNGQDIPIHDLEEFYLVASWFRRHPDELLHTVQP